MHEFTHFRPEDGKPVVFEAESHPKFIQIRLLTNAPAKIVMPMAAISLWPDWQRVALPLLIADEAQKKGLKLAEIGEDWPNGRYVAVLEAETA